MFTGIVEETGLVEKITHVAAAIELVVRSRICAEEIKIGDSLAVNGCCLTVASSRKSGRGKSLKFDLLQETWQRTNLQFVRQGSQVNLERSLRADGRLGGHFVSGHIDGLGKIVRCEKSGHDHLLEIGAPKDIMRYIVQKGSIAVDGISLTVDAVDAKRFRVWIIPQTLKVTALNQRHVGEAVNLEVDLLGKYIERFVTARLAK